MSSVPAVYTAIAAIQGELAKTGIAKDRRNQSQGYSFRGIDDVYGALSPLLSKHGLCILPRMLQRDLVERVGTKGNALFYVTVEAEFDFVAVLDGTKHTVRTFGEAMDSGDKATNKAMSAAYKYAAFQAFAIPTEGDNDADSSTHEVAAEEPKAAKRVKLEGPYTSKTALWTAVKLFDREVRSCGDIDEFEGLMSTDDTKALMAQVERDAPMLAHGGDSLPPEFEPLLALISKTRTSLEAQANEWRSNPLTGG